MEKTVYQSYKKWKWLLEYIKGVPMTADAKMQLITAFQHWPNIDGIWDGNGNMLYRRN